MPDIIIKPKIPTNAVEIRRGPLGRWLALPAGSPQDIADVSPEAFALTGLFDSVLESHRASKNQRYAAMKNDPAHKGLRIVAEGDSWFEYPYNNDLIMILGRKYPIMSLAKAGDAWADIQKKSELIPAVSQEHPQIVMLSIGGNDVMGSIETYVHQFRLGFTATDYIRSTFDQLLAIIRVQYEGLIGHLVSTGAHVIVHGSDYPDPRDVATPGAQWLGPPLKTLRGIDGVAIWREIANIMIDRFNVMMKGMASKDARIHYVDLRGTIGNKNFNQGPDSALWTDEIHGTAEGFGKLAKKLDVVIKSIAAKL